MINASEVTAPSARRRRYRRRGFVFVTIMVFTVGVAACGSSSSGSKGSSATGGSTTTAPAKEVSPAGDIPDNQAYVAYAPPGQKFSVKIPEGWARSATGGATVFSDKLNSIRMLQVKQPTAPTPASATADEVPKLAKSQKHFKSGAVSIVRRTAGNAVLVRFEADGAPDPVTSKVRQLAVERYTFWRNGRSVVLTLSGAKGADNVDPWRIVTNSFVWKP